MFVLTRMMHLPGIIVLVLFGALEPVYCETYQEYIASTLPNLCPYNKFCTVGPTKNMSDKEKTPCCQSCSCEDDCLIYGSCCPDSPVLLSTAGPVPPTAKCSVPLHHGNYFYQKSHLYFPHNYITYSCPNEYKNQKVIDKCIQPETLPLKDRVVVSDDRGRAFFNRFCAKCNSVQNSVAWNLQVNCEVYTNQLYNMSNLGTLVDNRCFVMSAPPTTQVASMSRCDVPDYASCNVTGRWAELDSFVQQACETSQFEFVVDKFFRLTYKNVYCYICNEEQVVDVNTQCSPVDSTTSRGQSILRFTAVLSPTEMGEGQSPPTDNRDCLSTEIYDYHFERCRALHCPVTMTPRDGKCAQVFNTMTSLTFLVLVNVTYEEVTTDNYFNSHGKNYPTFATNMERVASGIAADARIQACSLCRSYYFEMMNNQSSIFYLPVRTNNKCQTADLLESLKVLATKREYTRLKVGKSRLRFTTQISHLFDHEYDLAQFDTYNRQVNIFGSFPRCTVHIYLSPLFYCPYVELNPDDYKRLSKSANNKVDLDDFMFVENQAVRSTHRENAYMICVDKYLMGVSPAPYPKANAVLNCAMMTCVLLLISL